MQFIDRGKSDKFIVKTHVNALCYCVLKGVRMSQLRQEDSETVVSMLHRHFTDNRSKPALTSADLPVEDDQGSSVDNSGFSFKPNNQPSEPSQTLKESFENDSKCSSEAVSYCPVCGKSLQWVDGNEVLLNRHVDECLNKVAVGELLASERQTSSVSK